MSGKVVIAEAMDLVSRAALAHFESLGDWDIVALSRRAPDFASSAKFVAVDLMDAAERDTEALKPLLCNESPPLFRGKFI